MSGYNLTNSLIVYRMKETTIPIGGISMGIVAGNMVEPKISLSLLVQGAGMLRLIYLKHFY